MATTSAGLRTRALRIGRLPREAWAFAQLPPIARTVIQERLTYLSPGKMLELQRAVREIDDRTVAGAILEFGVALGGSAIALSHTSDRRRFHGLDLLGTVKDSFARHGLPVDGERISLHQGLFDEAWPQVAPSVERIALAHVDCDWYDPVRFCLASIAPLVSPGGIVVLGDYLDYDGCRAATDEFLSEHPEFSVRHRRGNISLVKAGDVRGG